MPDPKIHPASALQPRGINVIAAAKNMGVSPGTFRKLVRLGIAPAPLLKIPEIDCNIYDRVAIDAAMRAARHGAAADRAEARSRAVAP